MLYQHVNKDFFDIYGNLNAYTMAHISTDEFSAVETQKKFKKP